MVKLAKLLLTFGVLDCNGVIGVMAEGLTSLLLIPQSSSTPILQDRYIQETSGNNPTNRNI